MFYSFGFDNKAWKRWAKLGAQCQQTLREQQFTPGNPGTILKDVQTFLDFVGPGGLVTRSRNSSVPSEYLPELNRKIGHPIELPLKRPLLRDYPNLSGIFVLLRVMDILQMQEHRLVVDSEALASWQSLNYTEQYFALLEALLFQAQSAVLGGGRRPRESSESIEVVTLFLSHLSENWRNFSHSESVRTFGYNGELPLWNVFVQQQLGLIEIRPGDFSEKERKFWGGHGWLLGGAKLTSWGTAITWALVEFMEETFESVDEDAESNFTNPHFDALEIVFGKNPGQLETGTEDESSKDDLVQDEAPSDDATHKPPQPDFGILRPLLQPYFPAWQNLYASPLRQVRLGTHIFKVSLAGWRRDGSIWRRLAVPPDASLDDLAGAILAAFKFDDDQHLYDFRYRDQRGMDRIYNHPYSDEGPCTTEVTVGQTGLPLKAAMRFTFDYGDDWKFDVRLEKVETAASRASSIKVIGKAGKAPKQYPQSDW